MISEDMRTVKSFVESVLAVDDQARRSDKWLTVKVLQKMGQVYGWKIYVPYDKIDKMPSFESIRRTRAYLQNKEGLYRPSKSLEDRREEENIKMRELIHTF